MTGYGFGFINSGIGISHGFRNIWIGMTGYGFRFIGSGTGISHGFRLIGIGMTGHGFRFIGFGIGISHGFRLIGIGMTGNGIIDSGIGMAGHGLRLIYSAIWEKAKGSGSFILRLGSQTIRLISGLGLQITRSASIKDYEIIQVM